MTRGRLSTKQTQEKLFGIIETMVQLSSQKNFSILSETMIGGTLMARRHEEARKAFAEGLFKHFNETLPHLTKAAFQPIAREICLEAANHFYNLLTKAYQKEPALEAMGPKHLRRIASNPREESELSFLEELKKL